MMQGSSDDKGLAERLRLILNERGWTQAEMAKNCDISKRALESYLSGTSPGADGIRKIARGANVSADFLLFGEVNLIHEDQIVRVVNAAAYRGFWHFIGTLNACLADNAWRSRTIDHMKEKHGEQASIEAQKVTERVLRYMHEDHVAAAGAPRGDTE